MLFSMCTTEEFQRAVKVCTGSCLGSHIVNTVFNIFDADGDGHLSYKEFISIMKDRKYRGSRVIIDLFLVSVVISLQMKFECVI